MLEKTFELNFMWHQFVSFKESVKLKTKVTLFFGYVYFWNFYPLSHITLDVEYIIFGSQYWTLALSLDHKCEFTSGIKINYLAYILVVHKSVKMTLLIITIFLWSSIILLFPCYLVRTIDNINKITHGFSVIVVIS